jgi:serine/threonine-protein kinase
MDEYIGHYRIVSELGRGGMGVVYKAHEESLNRYVAIKELGSHLVEDPSYVERFVREAQSAAKLSHPNIVQIYAISEHQGRHFFVMEYVSGTSVQQILKSEGAMDTVRATQIVLQAASGLEEAHSQGIIHRDIKPANLMIDDRGLVKITDFGLAIALGGAARLTATGMMMGTPGYLSPEQCRDEGVDNRTDIYSLGVTYYEMLTGKMPFTASSPLALIRQIMEVEPPDVRELNPDVDAGTRELLLRMMDKNRDKRFADCTELIDQLQQDLSSRGATPAGPSAAIAPPPPPVDDQSAEALNSERTVVVESGAAPPVVGTEPVDPGTAPAAQPVSVAPPPPARKPRIALVAVLAVILVALGALALGVVAVWKLGVGERIAALTGGGAEETVEAQEAVDEPSEPVDQAAAVDTAAQGDAAATEGDQLTVSAEPAAPAPSVQQQGRSAAQQSGRQEMSDTGRQPRFEAERYSEGDRPRPETLPVVPPKLGVAVVAVGEPLLASEAEAYLEAALARVNAIVIDENTLPSVGRLLGGEQGPPRGAVREALRPHASHLILVRAEYLGDRPLRHIGGGDLAYQARLGAVALDLDSGQMVGQAFSRKVEYTHLTVERVVSESMRRWLRGVRGAMPTQSD